MGKAAGSGIYVITFIHKMIKNTGLITQDLKDQEIINQEIRKDNLGRKQNIKRKDKRNIKKNKKNMIQITLITKEVKEYKEYQEDQMEDGEQVV